MLEVGGILSEKGPQPESNLAKSLAIGASLQKRGFIKFGVEKTKVTWRGQLFRVYTHPGLIAWGIIIPSFIAITGILVAYYLSKSPVDLKRQLSTQVKSVKQSVNSDSSRLPSKSNVTSVKRK